LIRSIIPGASSELLSDIDLGIDIVENLVLTFEIPNCGGKYISFRFETSQLAKKKKSGKKDTLILLIYYLNQLVITLKIFLILQFQSRVYLVAQQKLAVICLEL